MFSVVVLMAASAACTPEPVALATRAQTVADAAPALSWVDLAVANCPTFDVARPGCTGPAPLELRFVALAPAAIDTSVWSFGDGSAPAVGASPTHTFRAPGSYAVSVAVGGGAGGTAQVRREMFVTVTPAPFGAPCDGDGACGEGGVCTCDSGCAGMPSGFCSRACGAETPCPAGSVCVDLGPRGTGDGWPGAACLVGCAGTSVCPLGWSCRQLPAVVPAGGWVRACFPRDVLADEGAACVGPTGAPEDGRCLGGDCAALGARGLCAAPCDPEHSCPNHAVCATFSNGERRCLARCADATACAADPFIACQAPSAAGRLGFTLGESDVKACAPRRCTVDGECGPDGRCDRGFCGKRST